MQPLPAVVLLHRKVELHIDRQPVVPLTVAAPDERNPLVASLIVPARIPQRIVAAAIHEENGAVYMAAGVADPPQGTAPRSHGESRVHALHQFVNAFDVFDFPVRHVFFLGL